MEDDGELVILKLRQKPTGEETTIRHDERFYSRGELRQNRPYKSSFVLFRRDIIS